MEPDEINEEWQAQCEAEERQLTEEEKRGGSGMTNREWLNTLSDEEWIKKASDLIDRCVFCEIVDIRNCHESDSECLKRQLAWLKAQHETTADEDFAEIGCIKVTGWKSGWKCQYKQENWEKYFRVDKDGCAFWTYEGGGEWEDSEIDQLRTIADKKRKELGWK